MRNNDNRASNFSTDLLALGTFGMNAKSSTLVDLSSGSRIAKNNIWNIENSINIKNLVSVCCHFRDFMNFELYISLPMRYIDDFFETCFRKLVSLPFHT